MAVSPRTRTAAEQEKGLLKGLQSPCEACGKGEQAPFCSSDLVLKGRLPLRARGDS